MKENNVKVNIKFSFFFAESGPTRKLKSFNPEIKLVIPFLFFFISFRWKEIKIIKKNAGIGTTIEYIFPLSEYGD